MVIIHQTFGDMLRWNPHFHCIVLDGGFDEEMDFIYIPFSDLKEMTEYFRRKVIAVIQDTSEIKKILRHLKKADRAPPQVFA